MSDDEPRTADEMAELFDDKPRKRSEYAELLEEIRLLKNEREREKYVRGDEEAVRRIDEQLRPKLRRREELHRLFRFRKTVPMRWVHDASPDDIRAAISAEQLIKVAQADDFHRRNALLLGPTKVGKSTALALMARRYILGGGDLVWCYSRTLGGAERRHPLGQDEPEEITKAKAARVLVLDDLGQEEHRDQGTILDVIHARYEAQLFTWTSSGLTYQQIGDRYGEHFARRLVECRGTAGRMVEAFPGRLH